MTVTQFIAKWSDSGLRERAGSQEHFIDLCRLVDHPTPADLDPHGTSFTFERGATKAGGGDGWADVWKKNYFGWEYKGPSGDLDAAYRQLLLYFGSLENPPLLVVADMQRILVYTHFPKTPTRLHEIHIDSLVEPAQLAKLRAVFHDPDALRPDVTVEKITEDAAGQITEVALQLRARGHDPQLVARFLDRIVFCLFAEDVGLLPTRLFSRVLDNTKEEPQRFHRMVSELFVAMAHGGDFGADTIRYFNGNLFQDVDVLELTDIDLGRLHSVAALDWSSIDPSIFGTLFERALDPDKRAQLGAHYTSREDIETLVDPVVMAPLRREWEGVREAVDRLLTGTPTRPMFTKARGSIRAFLDRLQSVTVLDPACGSGNFLYVTLQRLKDLEKEVIVHTARHFTFFPQVGPWQLLGIETNAYAYELAQMTVWIGYLQWVALNGFGQQDSPVLRPLSTFQRKDAILADDPSQCDPEWPAAEFIVSNPPFAGRAKLRSYLGDVYVARLFACWSARVPSESDYCCYWFEKARRHIEEGKCRRAGLLATAAIRSGASRSVLERIGPNAMFFAESDRPWMLDGAAVRVSMVGFDSGEETTRILDGKPVTSINSDLTSGLDVTQARRLPANRGRCFQGPVKVGAFDIPFDEARAMLREPNPHGLPNSDIIRPWWNGKEITGRPKHLFIVDFDDRRVQDAALFQLPFQWVESHVRPTRQKNRDRQRRERWWQLGRSGEDLRAATRELRRILCTVRVASHRLWVWADSATFPSERLYVVADDSAHMAGLLQSRVHEAWSLATASWHGVGNDPTYNKESCFESFPFPVTATSEQLRRIGSAATALFELRERWLNPPELTIVDSFSFLASTTGPWRYVVDGANAAGIGQATYRRYLPADESAEELLKERTLTALYNEKPTWLANAHRDLDEAVFAAYGLDATLSDEALLAELLSLNLRTSTA